MKCEIQFQFFSGFYESIWEYSDMFCDFESENDVEYDDYEFDSDGWHEAVCNHLVNCYNGWLADIFGEGAIVASFDHISSPREYNFSTDKCGVVVEIDDEVIERIKGKFTEHYEVISKWIDDNHRSRSGFISYLSNDADEWYELAFDEDEYRQPAYLSCLLEYIIIADQKKRGVYYNDGGLEYEAYETFDECADSYCTIKQND